MALMLGIFSVSLGVLLALSFALLVLYFYLKDITQKKHAILRNFPLIGRLRYFFEQLGEYFRQYFFLGDRDERPFDRSTRGWVYRMAKNEGGVLGFGTSIMLMPALVMVFGPREAVPIMAIASIMANASRVAAWWREVDWRVTAAYSTTGIPAAALGAKTLLTLSPGVVEMALGVFFIGMIPVRRWMARQHWTLTLWYMAGVGAVIGYITGIVVSTGPINAPFFLAYGLVKGAYLGTEAMGSLAVYLAKALTFRTLGALPLEIITKGLIIGSSLVGGAFIAKRLVIRLDGDRFKLMMDGLLLVSGLTMLGAAIRA